MICDVYNVVADVFRVVVVQVSRRVHRHHCRRTRPDRVFLCSRRPVNQTGRGPRVWRSGGIWVSSAARAREFYCPGCRGKRSPGAAIPVVRGGGRLSGSALHTFDEALLRPWPTSVRRQDVPFLFTSFGTAICLSRTVLKYSCTPHYYLSRVLIPTGPVDDVYRVLGATTDPRTGGLLITSRT
jgi:hypothetical protein